MLWIGILVAALFWVTLAVFKLIGAVIVFGFQLLLWTGTLITKMIEYEANRPKRTNIQAPEVLTPKRKRGKR